MWRNLLAGALILFFVLLLMRPWRLAEPWFDMPPAVADASDNKPVLADEYAAWRQWTAAFCPIWTDVLAKAKQAEQTALSDEMYMKSLEEKNAIKLYRCISWPETPDIGFLADNIPQDASIFKSTLTFMNNQINQIKANTAGALTGKPPVIAGFVGGPATYVPDCQLSGASLVCKFPLAADGTLAGMPSPAQMASRLAKLNSEIADLQPLFKTVKTGLADLNTIKSQAESGELFKAARL
jgi:hypothetical protein